MNAFTRYAGCMLALLASNVTAQSLCAIKAPEALTALRRDVDKRLASAPRAIERVHTEGTLPNQGIWAESMNAKQDWGAMRSLALLWKSQRDKADLDRLNALLLAWGSIYKISFNPIDETMLDAFIDAYVIAGADLPAETRRIAQDWIRRMGVGYLDRMERDFTPSDNRWVNNWNSHRVKLAVLAAAALDDALMWERARRQFKDHLGRNIRSDGSTFDFAERDALRYVVYNLEPLLRAALAAQERGEDWLRMKGAADAGLREALDWLAPYARGEKTHQEFVRSTVKFDFERQAAGVSGFSGQWDPNKSSSVFIMAATLDPSYETVSKKLPSPDNWIAFCWSSHRPNNLSPPTGVTSDR